MVDYKKIVDSHRSFQSGRKVPKSWKDNPPNPMPKMYEAHLHNLKAIGKDPYIFPSGKDKKRHYEQIRATAAKLIALLEEKDVYYRIANKVGEYDEWVDNMNYIYEDVFYMLERLATFEDPADTSSGRLDRNRRFFFKRLFQEVWTKDQSPTGTDFIKFCCDALIDADDPLEYSTVKTLIERQPREFWFESLSEKIKKDKKQIFP